MGQIDAHVLVLRLEESRIEFLEHQARDLGRGKQERQLRRVQELETPGLIGAVGVRIVGDAGDRRLEAVDGTMKEPVGERLKPQPSLCLALDDFGERHECACIEAVRAGYVGRVPQRNGFGHRNPATGNERRRKRGAREGGKQCAAGCIA